MSIRIRILALILCISLIAAVFPISAFAEGADTDIDMTEGDVISGFVPADTECISSDPSIAWVDENGSLNALKPGSVTITAPSGEYSVTVEDYDDGSEIVGNLKILARYNDSMQFYDGHVYLLFTSYQDGVEITVNDLYGGYEISDKYYEDIREDISNGSNHTGTDADKYFTFSGDMKSVTVDRGEIVTIGMYRGFDLTVPQAAFGSIKNSSFWTELVNTGKAAVVQNLFDLLENGRISTEEFVEKFKAIFDELGVDYNKALDGVVEGGVCFNRELYNQKLEWDQFENVTYELDITRNQLNMMQMYLGGNLNNFSILKNSCATVALRAWNAAVGTRNGVDTAYKLSSEAEGIYSVIDAPKGVRDNIVSRLPGYYLNNSEGVAEPDAGFTDDTGCVYVSAPEKVTPVEYTYEDDSVFVVDGQVGLTELINIAKEGQGISYNKDGQDVDVSIPIDIQDSVSTISKIDFSLKGKTVSVNADNAPDEGIWFSVKVADPVEGEVYYVEDADGNARPSEYAEGRVSFFAETLPVSYKITAGSDSSKNILRTVFVNGDAAESETEVYRKADGEKIALDSSAEVTPGEKIFIVPLMAEDESYYIVSDILINGESIYNSDNFDAEENAYYFVMPENYSQLTITYAEASVVAAADLVLQVKVGDTLDVADYARLYIGDEIVDPDKLRWTVTYDPYEGGVENDGKVITALKYSGVYVRAYAESNINIGVAYYIEIYDSFDDMYAVSFGNSDPEYNIMFTFPEYENEYYVLKNGYLVGEGAELTVVPDNEDSKAIFLVTANNDILRAGETYTVEKDTEIYVSFADASVRGVPESISLSSQGDTYQLEAETKYDGLLGLIPIYDSSITYTSSDPLVTVDETGLITVAGEVPEDGKLVYVTAYAGSSNNKVFAVCKVVVGDYKGSKIVGKVTVSARRIVQEELVAHSEFVFTTYEDIDLSTSYYDYFKPNDKYNDLMRDYADNPENYSSDPALYNGNELNLEDRESYFDEIVNGSESDPQIISLKAGESISASNYSYDRTHLTLVRKSLEGDFIYLFDDTQMLVNQMKLFEQGQEIDAAATFDPLVSTLSTVVAFVELFGVKIADGKSIGGTAINRELYNQFRRNDSQLPNNYYTIEITADELAALKLFLADPENNYYSLFTKNCTTGVTDLWNTTLYDKPELHLSGNFTGLAADPEELYFEIGALRLKPCLEGEGGTDYYPRSVAYSDAVKDAIALIDSIGKVELTDECKQKIDAAREAVEALSDVRKDQIYNLDILKDAENVYDALVAQSDREAFEQFKSDAIAAADALAKEDDSNACKTYIEIAKKLIEAMPYADGLSLEENEAAVSAVLELLEKTLENQRIYDHPLLGDVDRDGIVTIIDATIIQRKVTFTPVFTIIETAVADADQDGIVTIVDATYIQRWVTGLDSNENIGKPIR